MTLDLGYAAAMAVMMIIIVTFGAQILVRRITGLEAR
jgi:uncharacterized membrane-anchored protein